MASAASAPPCPACGGTGWKMAPPAPGESFSRAQRCECQLAQRGAELMQAARIPPRYERCDLKNFHPPEGNRELALAFAQAAAYARDYPGGVDRERSGLLFYGGVGTGKTHLAVALLQELLDRGIACRFADCRELLKQIQATFDPANPATESGVVAPLLEVEVLLLDDLGVGRATEWAIETLHYILNHRYSQRRATLITSNLEDRDPAPGDKDLTLGQAIGERLRSRLYEMCVFVAMHGADHRRGKAAILR